MVWLELYFKVTYRKAVQVIKPAPRLPSVLTLPPVWCASGLFWGVKLKSNQIIEFWASHASHVQWIKYLLSQLAKRIFGSKTALAAQRSQFVYFLFNYFVCTLLMPRQRRFPSHLVPSKCLENELQKPLFLTVLTVKPTLLESADVFFFDFNFYFMRGDCTLDTFSLNVLSELLLMLWPFMSFSL